MKINQAFEILKNAGGIRAARIITENTKKLTRFNVWYMARQLRHGVPVAKIIHQKWFFGLKFYTNRHTLDPRPDTETLVSAVISDCPNGTAPHVLDLGTGTGCIIAALAKNVCGLHGVGIDRSRRAVRVARRNIKTLGLQSRIKIKVKSFNSIGAVRERFDIIVSNPPYIAVGDGRVNDAAKHDPAMALYANENGLAAYKTIACNAKNWIRTGGKLYLEIGADQDISVRDIFVRCGWTPVRAEYDLGGIIRVLVFTI